MRTLSLLFAFTLVCESLFAQTSQSSLAKKWHEAAKTSSYEKFKTDHFLIDVAEDFWVSEKKLSKPPFSKDISVSAFQTQTALTHSILRVDLWLPAFIRYIQNLWDRPLDASHQWVFWYFLIAPPLLLALILVLGFKLMIWASVFKHHSSFLFFWKSSNTLPVLLAIIVLFGIFSQEWIWTAHLLLCLSIIYSRNLKPVLIGAIITASFIFLQPMVSVFQKSLSDLNVLESMSKGRTRLIYSEHATSLLSPIEKAIWSDMNGDQEGFKTYLQSAEPSQKKSILLINAEASQMSNSALISAYEKLAEEYPGDALIRFNLAQLYTRAQNLVKADQARLKLPTPVYEYFQNLAEMNGKLLVNPVVYPGFSHWMNAFEIRGKEQLNRLGFYPFSEKRGGASALYYLLPWILLFYCLQRRQSAPGLCKQTGEITPSPNISVSVIYQSSTQKNDGRVRGHHRQQVDQMVRAFQQKQRRRFTFGKFFIPQLGDLLEKDTWLPSFFKLSLLLVLIWWAIPFRTRREIFPEIPFAWAPSEMSWSLLILFGIAWVYFFMENQKRGHS
ncbi:MAG: hypothetical protein J0L93_03635 [Deltaproteobacteria bacterium]|nr:hypothetical protein [Deltaproteobacteria bacterium]